MSRNKTNFRYVYLIFVALLPLCFEADAASRIIESPPIHNLIDAIKRNSAGEITAILEQNSKIINDLYTEN